MIKSLIDCRRTFFYSLVLFLTSCATSYQPSSFSGGYDEHHVKENIYKISFSGNSFVGQSDVRTYFLRRSAELGIELGYEYLAILDSDNYTTYLTTTNNTYNANTTYNQFTNSYNTTVQGPSTMTYSKPNTSGYVAYFKSYRRPTDAINTYALFVETGGDIEDEEFVEKWNRLLANKGKDEQAYNEKECSSGNMLNCLLLAYDLQNTDQPRSYHLAKKVCESSEPEDVALGCYFISTFPQEKNNRRLLSKKSCDQALKIKSNYKVSLDFSKFACGIYGALTNNLQFFEAGKSHLESNCYALKDAVQCYNLSVILSLKNKTKDSLKYLQEAFKYGFTNIELVNTEPDFKNLRNSKEFKDFIKNSEPRNPASK